MWFLSINCIYRKTKQLLGQKNRHNLDGMSGQDHPRIERARMTPGNQAMDAEDPPLISSHERTSLLSLPNELLLDLMENYIGNPNEFNSDPGEVATAISSI